MYSAPSRMLQVLCGDGGQRDPVLYALDRGLATGFCGLTDGRVKIVCRPRAARSQKRSNLRLPALPQSETRGDPGRSVHA